MRLLGQSQALFFFYKKILSTHKFKSNQNQLTKQTQANKKQQRQWTKTSKRGKIVCFVFLRVKNPLSNL